MNTTVLELCEGSEGKWEVKLGGRICPVCRKLSTTIAKETSTTGNGGRIPRHMA